MKGNEKNIVTVGAVSVSRSSQTHQYGSVTGENMNCPKCGADLPDNAPAGICPKCLMEAALDSHEDAGQATSATTTSHPTGFVPPEPAELSPHFPQLEMLALLGQGGMGAVYKARQPGLDRLVAVKILPPEISRTPGFAERFAREARALARLSHPHIVTVYDSGERDGLFYFVMEYVDGTNLRELIRAGNLEPNKAMAIVPQVCEALQFAHENGIVHRDIKPENILVDKTGRVKIADFGLAKLLARTPDELTLTHTHQVMGTPRYMAPEQIEGSHNVDHRADIYSLGVVFYELLTGELPLGRFDPPSHRVQIDVRLDEVVLRTLEKSPDRRYQRASEVKTAVESLGSGEAVDAGAYADRPLKSLSPAELEQLIVAQLRAGDKIEAIHTCRVGHGMWGLAEAKTAVEDIARRHGIQARPEKPPADESLVAEGRYLLRGPAIAMMILGAASVVAAIGVLVYGEAQGSAATQETANWAALIIVVYAGLVCTVGLQMLRRQWRLFAAIAAAMLVAPVPIVMWATCFDTIFEAYGMFEKHRQWMHAVVASCGAPIALWTTFVIWRLDVRAAYQEAFRERVFKASLPKEIQTAPDEPKSVEAPEPKPVPLDRIKSWLLGPAIALIVLACLHVAGALFMFTQMATHAELPSERIGTGLVGVLLLILATVIAVAGILLKDLRGYTFAFVVSILVMLPFTPLMFIGLPIAAWTIWLLVRKDVREAFRERAETFDASVSSSLALDEMLRCAESLHAPAIGLTVTGVMYLLVTGNTAVAWVELLFGEETNVPTMVLIVSLSIAVALFQIAAGILMRKAKAYPLCVVGGIVAVLPLTFAWVVNVSLGAWVIYTLSRREVRELFAADVDMRNLRQQAERNLPSRRLEESPYFAAGQLFGGFLQFVTTPMCAAILSFLAAATVLLPWGYYIREGVYPPVHLGGFNFWSADIVAALMSMCGLFLLATGGLEHGQLWRPLIVVGFVMPTLGLLSAFRHVECFLHNITHSLTRQVDGVGIIDGYYACWVFVIALLVVAALQIRAALQEHGRAATKP